jgi:hypothetical protein
MTPGEQRALIKVREAVLTAAAAVRPGVDALCSDDSMQANGAVIAGIAGALIRTMTDTYRDVDPEDAERRVLRVAQAIADSVMENLGAARASAAMDAALARLIASRHAP